MKRQWWEYEGIDLEGARTATSGPTGVKLEGGGVVRYRDRVRYGVVDGVIGAVGKGYGSRVLMHTGISIN